MNFFEFLDRNAFGFFILAVAVLLSVTVTATEYINSRRK